MTITKWSHISMLGGDPWVLPIWNAINSAVTTSKIAKPSEEFYQVGMSISIRFDMLPRVVRRINASVVKLYSHYQNIDEKYIYEKGKRAYAFDVDDELTYSLIIDTNSLLFEMNATWELIKTLIRNIYQLFGADVPSAMGLYIGSLLNEQSNQTWFRFMDENRNHFIHEGTSYIAVDVTNAVHAKYDLLFMKENLDHFDNEDKYIKLSQMSDMVQGFLEARMIIRAHLIKKVQDCQQ